MNTGPTSHTWSFGSFVCVRSSPRVLWDDLQQFTDAEASAALAAQIQVVVADVGNSEATGGSSPSAESEPTKPPRLHAA